jgi:integrin beta 3
MRLDVEKFIAGLHDYIGKAMQPLTARVKALEDRAPVPGPKGEPGERGEAGPAGKDGTAGAHGKDGAPGQPGERGERGEQGPAGKDGAPGERGEKGEPGAPGKDGADGQPGRDGRDGIDGKDGADGLPGRDGRDGVDGKDADPAEIERMVSDRVALELPAAVEKALDALLPVIATKAAELVPVPKDGRDGRDGQPGVQGERGRDGVNGKDGLDGLSIEDFEVSLDGRVFTFALRNGERTVEKQIKVPFPVDRGVYRKGMRCEQGDVVTYGGSQWIALKDTDTSPPGDDWRLQVQRGRDGKDAQ